MPITGSHPRGGDYASRPIRLNLLNKFINRIKLQYNKITIQLIIYKLNLKRRKEIYDRIVKILIRRRPTLSIDELLTLPYSRP